MKALGIILAGLLLAALTVLPYWKTGGYDLVNCDDYDYLSQTADKPLNDLSQGIWMPLTWTSYRLDEKLAARLNVPDTTILHLHSTLVHGANAFLLFLLLFALCESTPLAFVAAALWALHPLRVESVAWIASRKDVLSMFFLLLALIPWTLRTKHQALRAKHLALYTLSLLAFAVAATAKPSVMCFPVLAFLIDFLIVRRKLIWWEYVLPTLLALAIAGLATYAQKAGGATETLAVVPLWWKCLNAATSVGIYLYNSLVPLHLAPQCLARWPSLPRQCLVGLVLCATFLALGYRLARYRFADERGKTALAGIAWFLVAIFPMLGIMGFGVHAFADRFTYIPSVGLSILIIALLPRPRHYLWLVPVVAAFGVLTARQAAIWENDGTAWAHTIKVDGDANRPAHANLGLYHYEFTHDLDAAIAHFEAAGNDEKYIGTTHPYWILALCERGEREKARDPYMTLSGWSNREAARARARGLNVGSVLGYRIARAVWLWESGDEEFKDIARKEAAELSRLMPDHVEVKYLRYIIGELPKSAVTADPRKNYVCFRFLNK